MTDDQAVVSVHLASASPGVLDDRGAAPPVRKRRKMVTNTYTLTSTNATQRVMPRSANRVEGWVTAATEATPPAVYMATNQADAAQAGGGSAPIVGADTTPFPAHTTDEVWLSATTGYPVTIGVVQIFETDEPG